LTKVLFFQIAQLLIILSFTIFISDLRKKRSSEPLLSKSFIKIMKLSYIIPIAIYGYTLVTLNVLFTLDYLAILLTLLGTVTVIKAKMDLGSYHVWTGYKREDTELVVRGIYRWIRHPLYVGIFIFIFGALFTVIPHVKWFLLVPFFASLSYIVIFLIIASKRETSFLRDKFGDRFSQYCEKVHPFLPFYKYDDS